MRVIETKVYRINELPDEARGRAHNDYLNDFWDWYGWESENRSVIDWLNDIFGYQVECTGWSYDGWSYDYSLKWVRYYTVEDDPQDWDFDQRRIMAWVWSNLMPKLLASRVQQVKGYSTKSRKSKVFYSEELYPTGYCASYGPAKFISDVAHGLIHPGTFEEFVRECYDKAFEEFNADVKGCQTLEYFIDMSEANNWEYTEDGHIA